MKPFRLLLFLLMLSGALRAQEIDLTYYKNAYPFSESVLLQKSIEVSFYINEDTQKLQAKVTHDIVLLALRNSASELSLVQLPFTSYNDVRLISAKFYLLDSLNIPKLKERIKTKHIEEKDYYINGIFYSDLKVKQFAPSKRIKAGSVLKYKYEETYEDVKFLTKIMAQAYTSQVVDSFQLIVNIPSYVQANITLFNMQQVSLTTNETSDYGSLITTYSIDHIKPIENTGFLAPRNYVLPHFFFQVKSYSIDGVTINLLNNIDALYGWYKSLINELNPDDAVLKKLVNKITEGETTDVGKIDKLFKWMQLNIQYVAFEDGLAGFKPEEAQQVYHHLFGDCKGMANLLVSLLKASGFEAYHTWIGTRTLPYDYSIPSLAVDNHMICALKFENEMYFLDATDKSTQWNVPSAHIQGKTALVGIGDEAMLMEVPVTISSKNKINVHAKITINENPLSLVSGTIELTGLVRNKYSNRVKYASTNSKHLVIQGLVRNYFDDFIADDKEMIVTDDGFIMNITFTGKLAGIHTYSKNKFELYPNLGSDLRDFLKQDTIIYPIYVRNRFELNYDIEYSYPTSYSTKALPQPVNLDFLEKESSFSSSYKKTSSNVIYTSKLVLDKELIPLDQLEEWNKYMVLVRSAVYQPLKVNKL